MVNLGSNAVASTLPAGGALVLTALAAGLGLLRTEPEMTQVQRADSSPFAVGAHLRADSVRARRRPCPDSARLAPESIRPLPATTA